MPVAMFLIEIAAWGTNPPDWSVTVPESVAPATWALAVVKKVMNTTETNARKHAAVFVERILENMGASKNRWIVTILTCIRSRDQWKGPASRPQRFPSSFYCTSKTLTPAASFSWQHTCKQ